MIKVLCLVGASACGKDTLLKQVLKKSPHVVPIVRYTTRPMRENEVNGVDYYFVDNEKFTEKVLNLEMAEAAIFNDWFYGTDKTTLSKELVNILICDLNAAEQLAQDSELDVAIAYIKAEPKERLLRALKREKDPNVNEIVRRFIDDEKKYCSENMFDISYFTIENNSKTQMKAAIGKICDIIESLFNN